MKVLHVIPSYEPAWAFGGTVTATSNLCRGLAKKGIDITVYTTNADGKGGYLNVPLNKPVDLGGVKVWYFCCDLLPKKAFYSRGLVKKLRESVKEFDLVHMSTIWQWIGVDVFRICNKFKAPYIVTPHSSLMESAFSSVGFLLRKKIYWNIFGKKIIQNAQSVHFLCEGERKESDKFCNGKQSFTVPNGIKVENFGKDLKAREFVRKKLKIPNDGIILLFLGRIHSKKQIELVLRSIPSILKHKKNVYFIIVGPVEDKTYSKKLMELTESINITKNLRWVGPAENKDVLNFYSAADIMVLPSKVEGVSMSITEAMAMSLPVLISDKVANYKEVELDNAGVVIHPNLNYVKNTLIDLCTNEKLLTRISQNARKSAKKRYAIDKVTDFMIKAYEDVLTGRRSTELQWK